MAVIGRLAALTADLGSLTADGPYGRGCGSALAPAVSNCDHKHISVRTVVAKVCGRICRITV